MAHDDRSVEIAKKEMRDVAQIILQHPTSVGMGAALTLAQAVSDYLYKLDVESDEERFADEGRDDDYMPEDKYTHGDVD